MKKSLLHAVVTCLLLFGVTSIVQAETKVYGLTVSTSFGTFVAEADLDAVNTNDKTALTKGVEILGLEDLVTGTSVGKKYYALGYDSKDYNFGLYSINFTTGNVVNIATYKNGKIGDSMTALCYDETTGTLYGAEQTCDAEENWYTALYSINPNNGELTQLATYEKKDVKALVADGKGGLYMIYNGITPNWQYAPRVWHINTAANYEKTDFLVDSETTCNSGSCYSALLSADGNTIYYMAYSQLLAIDLTAKTISVKGELKSNMAGITFTKSTEDATSSSPDKPKANTRLLVSKTWFGDVMGTVPADVDMKKEYYFYNSDYKLSRISQLGRTYDNSNRPQPYTIMYYTKNDFDANGNVSATSRYQYGLYDFGDLTMKKSNVGNVAYQYNDKGQLVSKNDGSYNYYYTYDEEGNVATEELRYITNGEVSQSHSYFDYVAPGKPGYMVSTGRYSSYVYNEIYTYDDDLNLVSADRIKLVEDKELGGQSPVSIQREEWVYENKVLVRYVKYSFDNQGQPVANFKIEYELVEGDVNKVMSTEYISSDNGVTWKRQNLPCLQEYREFGDMAEDVSLTATAAPIENAYNSVGIKMDAPAISFVEDVDFAIFRNGMPIDTVNISQLLNEDVWGLFYTDKDVYNGTYDYFVQPLVVKSDEEGNAISKTGYNISNPMTVSLQLALPAVTNLNMSAARKEKVGTGLTATTERYATISWTNPEYPEEYGFISNSLMLDRSQAAEADTTDAQVTSLEANIYSTHNIYVLTRYKYGKAISDTIQVSVSDVDNMISTGISSTASVQGVDFQFVNKTVSLGEKANMMVFAANGELRMKAMNADKLDLNQLSAGSYIICVEKNGKTHAVKVSVK